MLETRALRARSAVGFGAQDVDMMASNDGPKFWCGAFRSPSNGAYYGEHPLGNLRRFPPTHFDHVSASEIMNAKALHPAAFQPRGVAGAPGFGSLWRASVIRRMSICARGFRRSACVCSH